MLGEIKPVAFADNERRIGPGAVAAFVQGFGELSSPAAVTVAKVSVSETDSPASCKEYG
jgi:hypothetical protein